MNHEILLCRYQYDPLDRLATSSSGAPMKAEHCFYQKDCLATLIGVDLQRSIMQHDDLVLAQQDQKGSARRARVLASDQHRSVLAIFDTILPDYFAYTPYGNCLLSGSLLGFNGERLDPITKHYLLGKGYRAFNPVLMRFNSPDNKSPFGEGGLNAYAYCEGDPVNYVDPTGHNSIASMLPKFILNKLLGSSRTPKIAFLQESARSASGLPLRIDPIMLPGPKRQVADLKLSRLAAECVNPEIFSKFSKVLDQRGKIDPHGIRAMQAFTGDSNRPFDFSNGVQSFLPMPKAHLEMILGVNSFKHRNSAVVNDLSLIFHAYPAGLFPRPSVTKAASNYIREVRSGSVINQS